MVNSDTLFKIILCTVGVFFSTSCFFQSSLWLKELKISLFQFRNEQKDLEVWMTVLALSLNVNLTLSRAPVLMVSVGLLVPVFKQGSDATMNLDIGPEILHIRRRKRKFLAEVLQIQAKNLPRSFFLTHTITDF